MNWKEKGKRKKNLGVASRRCLAARLVPGLRTETKGETFSPETLVPSYSPRLEVLLDRDYSPVVQPCQSAVVHGYTLYICCMQDCSISLYVHVHVQCIVSGFDSFDDH
jgi:hypothetical protein